MLIEKHFSCHTMTFVGRLVPFNRVWTGRSHRTDRNSNMELPQTNLTVSLRQDDRQIATGLNWQFDEAGGIAVELAILRA